MAKEIRLKPHSYLVGTPLFQLRDADTGRPSGTYAWGSVVFPEFEPDPSDDVYVTTETDIGRLDLVAYRFYGDINLWWVIAHSNDILDQFSDSTDGGLPAGTRLRIPKRERVLSLLQQGSSTATSATE